MKNNSRKRLLIATQDPGGAAALLPVINHLKNDLAIELKIFSGKYSYGLFKKNKINFLMAGDLNQKELTSQFKIFNPTLVFASNSFGLSVEKKILRIARKLGIPSISIIDFWSNYWLRFVNGKEKRDIRYLPDKIVVIDNFMKTEMTRMGFPKEKLEVLGNPAFDSCKDSHLQKRNSNFFQILFASQPLREIYGKDGYFDFDEHEVLNDISKVLAELGNDKKIVLVVRLHPKEKIDKFKEIKFTDIRVKIDQESELDVLISESDLILGMNSMALFRAALLGKPVISYQPGIERKNDCLVSNKLGLSELVSDKTRLKEIIVKSLSVKGESKPKKTLIKNYTDNNSTKKVADLIHSYLNK